MKTPPLLDIQNLSAVYGTESVLNDVSLSVQAGEIVGIAGESGSGKSTLIRAVAGLLNKSGKITGGRIYYQGSDLLTISKEKMRCIRGPEIGMVFQNAGAALCPVRTIEAQLCEAVNQHRKRSKEQIRSAALELFAKIGLKDGESILQRYPFELSGGMNQRVGIALAMILKPRLLLADEPTSALDVITQAQVLREMRQMRDIFAAGIIIVTHNIAVIERTADKTAVMRRGRIIECGATKNVINNPKDPYTKKLLRSVPRLNKQADSHSKQTNKRNEKA